MYWVAHLRGGLTWTLGKKKILELTVAVNLFKLTKNPTSAFSRLKDVIEAVFFLDKVTLRAFGRETSVQFLKIECRRFGFHGIPPSLHHQP